MNALDFFKHDTLRLPLNRHSENYGAFLDRTFQSYISLVDSLDETDPIGKSIKIDKDDIVFLCESILKAVGAYHDGLPSTAYGHISGGIEQVWPHFQRLRFQITDHSQYKELYRLRVAGPEGGYFGKKDLFHIPFDKRHLVTRQRYSIPGLPCIYLGATLHVCWVEMGRPIFDSLYIARYEKAEGEEVYLLDLSQNPKWVASRIESAATGLAFDLMHSYCRDVSACWPLMAACSVLKRHDAAPFIEEYIVPQLVLQWVMENEMVDGIQYFSVKTPPRADYPFATVNVVLPAREPATDGLCARLKKKVHLTEPASWQLLAPTPTWQATPRWTPQHDEMQVELVKGQPIRYGSTHFGIMEGYMVDFNCGPI